MGAELRAALLDAVASVRAASSAWRPHVAEYLYDRALATLYDGLAALGPVSTPLVADIWRLMLDTVATRRFGVSTDGWRSGDHPDRYFPIVWIDVLPRCMPAWAPDARLAHATALFNLGENLPRGIANGVAAELSARIDALSRDPESTLRAIVRASGALGPSSLDPTAWTSLNEGRPFDCGDVDRAFLPGAVAADIGRRFIVTDALRPVALHLEVAADGLTCRAQGAAPDLTIQRHARVGEATIGLEGRTIGWSSPDAARPLAEVDAIAPAALAANEAGDVLVIDAASTRIRWWRAAGPGD